MLKMPKEDSRSMGFDEVVRFSDWQYPQIGPALTKSAKWHDEILNMVSMASHDIRDSVVSIAAALKLINKGYYGKIGEDVSHEIEKLMGKLSGIIGIVEDSLSRSVCLNGELGQLHEELDLHADILEPVLNELYDEIWDAGVIIYNAHKTAPKVDYNVRGNRFLLKAVIRNLLKNAMKYGGQGTRIAFGFVDSDDYVIVNIYNSGIPVHKESRDRLFKKFDQVSPERKSSEGIGLGLYLVKEIITKHGGTIWYEAKKQGSNFVFTLPKN